jgi:hypothetical protein
MRKKGARILVLDDVLEGQLIRVPQSDEPAMRSYGE